MKKIFLSFAAMLAATFVLGTQVQAVNPLYYSSDNEEQEKELTKLLVENYHTIYLDDKKAWDEYTESHAFPWGDDGGNLMMMVDMNYLSDFKANTNKIIKFSYILNRPGNETEEEFVNNPEFDAGFWVAFFTADGQYFPATGFNMYERQCYTISEFIEKSGIENYEDIGLVTIECSTPDVVIGAFLEDYRVYNCEPGWNVVGGDRYYVNSKGNIVTNNCTINGIRYKFGKNGVCGGKYTGWTKNSKGRRYWKDGVLQKNTEITAESGKVYTIDKNGYAKVKK